MKENRIKAYSKTIMMESKIISHDDEKIIDTAVHLSVIEVGLGSLLHAFHIPLAGHVLSLNQGVFLEQSVPSSYSRAWAFRHVFISSVSISLMKSLSPAGKKLGPMISISSQGFLLGCGYLILGNNLIGRMLGMALLSLWAFVQPFVTYMILFGLDLIKGIEYLLSKIQKTFGIEQEQVLWALAIAIGIKVLIAMFLPFFSDKLVEKIRRRIRVNSKSKRPKRRFRGKVFLILSFVLMAGFYFLHGKDIAETFWLMMRPISLIILITYITKTKLFNRYVFSKFRRFEAFEKVYQIALEVKARTGSFSENR